MRHALTALAIVAGLLYAADRPAEARTALPHCAVEDASRGPVPCVWYAKGRGNQEGNSFRVYANGNFKYIPHHRARYLLGL